MYYTISSITNFVASFVVTLVVLIGNYKSLLNRSFAKFSASVTLWAFGYTFWQLSDQFGPALFWIRLAMLGSILIPPTFTEFAFQLTNNKNKLVILRRYNWALTGFLLLFSYSSFFIKTVKLIAGFQFWPTPGILFYVFHIFFAANIVCSCVLIYINWRKAVGLTRAKLGYVLVAVIVGFSGGMTNHPLWYGIKIPPIGNIGVTLTVVLIAYAIAKHHLMDIRVFASKAVAFLLSYPVFLAIPFFFAYRLQPYLYNLWGSNWWLAPSGLLVFFATLLPLAYGQLQGRMENILLAEQKRYQKALKEFALTLIFIKDMDKLTKKVVSKIMDSISLNFCAIYLKQDGAFSLSASQSKDSFKLPAKVNFDSEFIKELKGSNFPLLKEYLPKLEETNIGLACPLLLNRKLSGFIVLGQKEKGNIFTGTDLDIFSIVSAQTSLALSEIYYFKAYQKATEQRHKLELEKTRLESAFQIAEAYRHELGNIINVISMSLMNLSSVGGVEPSKEDIEQTRVAIRNNVKRANYIFNAVSKYNENSDSVFQPQKLDKLINGTLEEYKEQINKQQIKLDLNLEKEIRVEANNNLPFALGYLIKGAITAIEYTNPEEKLIKIELTTQNKQALLKISDTGGDVNQDKVYQGLGIERGKEGGILYFLARRIIFDHQGDFEVESLNKNTGTTFTVKLPLYPSQ